MAEQDELYQLIRSMSRNEKGYFKKFSTLNSKQDNNYVRLFDAIDEQAEYNEQALKRQFKGDKFIVQLHVTKNYLHKLILKSLRNFYSASTAAIEINDLLTEAEIMINRKMYRHAQRLLTRARKNADQSGKLQYFPVIARWENAIKLNERYGGVSDTEFAAWNEDYLQSLENLKKSAEYEILYNKIIRLYAQTGFIKTEEENTVFEELMQSPLLKEFPKSAGLSAQMVYFDIFAFYYSAKGEQEKYLTITSDIVKHLKAQPAYLTHAPFAYMFALQNCINANMKLGYYEAVPAMLADIKELKVSIRRDELYKEYILTVLELSYLTKMRDFESACQIVEQKGARILEMLEDMFPYNKYDQCLKISIIYAITGHYEKALIYLNKVLNAKDCEQFSMYELAKVWSVIIHFELKNYALMPHLLLSVTRLLIRRNRQTPVEKVFLSNFRKLSGLKGEKDIHQYLLRFRNEMRAALANTETQAAEQQDILYWLERKTSAAVDFSSITY
jgi:hypothetical protein